VKTGIRRRRILILLLGLGAAAVLLFILQRIFTRPSAVPEGTDYAVVTEPEDISPQEAFETYSDDNDPAHPVLDVRVDLKISNRGSRPGESRTEAAAEIEKVAYLRPNIRIPDLTLPELYITNEDAAGVHYTGEQYTLVWEYTGGRQVIYRISLSTDGGENYTILADERTEKAYTVTFPDTPSEQCILRVSAMLNGREYKTADTAVFAIEAGTQPEPPSDAETQEDQETQEEQETQEIQTPAPIEHDIDPNICYVDRQGLYISNDSGLPVWFSAESRAVTSAKLVWQLSGIPFLGTAQCFGQEKNILASGELDTAGGEFSVDLKKICEDADSAGGGTLLPYTSGTQARNLYIRVIALDSNGRCIGDPGRGIYFQYGPQRLSAALHSNSLTENSEIQILMEVPVPYTSYKQTWKHIAPDVFNADLDTVSDRVLFLGSTSASSDMIKNAVRVELQVATSPFSNFSSVGIAQPQGLVYQYLDTAPEIGNSSGSMTYLTPWFHGIEYQQFVPEKQELDEMGGIYYYVRGLFYVPDETDPAVTHTYTSETLTIAYRVTSASKNEVQQIAVRSDMPYMQFYGYQPIQWQQSDYEEYFEVARHIEAEEMNFSISKGSDFLLPYAEHISKYHWTREQYQAKLDAMLPQGAVIHYVKAKPGFWDEFFGLLKAIYSGVSGAYADAKSSVVSLIDYIPLIGDDARALLKTAASCAIDYGLASIGLPPSLPNIDQLAKGGMDYLLKVSVEEALREAGIPADSPAAQEITAKVRGEVAAELSSELEKAVLSQQQNPLHADFLRLYTKKLYAPAYIDVFVCNYSKTRSTRSGQLFFSCGNSFDVYRTACVPVPALKPSEHTVIRIYLDHLRNQYDGYNKYFDEKYNGTSGKPYKMLVYADFDLPDVTKEAKAQGLAPAPLPYVTEYVYDHSEYRFEREFVPAQPVYESDSAPNAQEYLD